MSCTVSFSDVSDLPSCLSDWVDRKHLGMLVSQICIYYINYIYIWYTWLSPILLDGISWGNFTPKKYPGRSASGTRAVVCVGCLSFTWLRTWMAEGLNSVLVLADDCHSNEWNVEWGQWIRGIVQFLLWKDGSTGNTIRWMKMIGNNILTTYDYFYMSAM